MTAVASSTDKTAPGPGAALPAVPVYYVRHVVAALGESGIAAEAALAGSGVAQKVLEQADARIAFAAQLRIYQNAARLHPDPAFGLELGRRLRVRDHGVLGYAVYCSADLAQALRVVEQYQSINGPLVATSTIRTGDKLRVQLEPVAQLGEALRIASDEALALLAIALIRLTAPTTRPVAIRLGYDVDDVGVYISLFDCPVTTGATITEIIVDADAASRPLHMSDAEMAAVCAERCRELLASLAGYDETVDAVRRAIVTDVRACRSLDVVATRLHISGRTLRRRLQAAGTTFRKVRDEVLCGMATDYLERTDLAVDEIADLLGYRDAPNFYRAFRRWRGVAPGVLRRQRRQT